MQLPDSFPLHHDFALRDNALAILFPDFWIRYRSAGNSFHCSSKVRIIAVHPNDHYVVQLFDCAPEEGRIQMPLRTYETVTLRQLRLAIALTLYQPPQELPPDQRLPYRHKPISEEEAEQVR